TSHSASLTVTVDTQIAINNIELVNDSGIPDDKLTNNVRPHFHFNNFSINLRINGIFFVRRCIKLSRFLPGCHCHITEHRIRQDH
ncbi:hypothetical protein ONK27_26730, partial [Salmonella enterica subsp. enterica serovar Virginia]|nr:hypothetical protein [Salmonella enterica subsp. enterica serovar Virginia]